MKESQIERLLVDGVRDLGGKAYKFVSPGNDGVPDRIVVLPNGFVVFVELKTTTGRLSPIQIAQQKKLRELDQYVFTLYGDSEVKKFLDFIQEYFT